jgi:hypothetical protein
MPKPTILTVVTDARQEALASLRDNVGSLHALTGRIIDQLDANSFDLTDGSLQDLVEHAGKAFAEGVVSQFLFKLLERAEDLQASS